MEGSIASTITSNKKRKFSQISSSSDADIDINIFPRFAFFDELPDDLVANIASKLAATASCPADFFNLRLTCKRLNELGLDRTVLSKLSPKGFTCTAKNWCPEAQNFMTTTARAGNLEAVYTLGMIRFYVHKDIKAGKSMIDFAAKRRHRHAMFSMFVIQFYGSGGTTNDKNWESAVNNCIGAALIGHVDAIRELGYRLKDGHIAPKNVEEGRRLLLQATAREIVSRLRPDKDNEGRGRISIPVPASRRFARGRWLKSVPRGRRLHSSVADCDLSVMTDFGWDIPDPVPHPVNCFLTEWFGIRRGRLVRNGLRLCRRAMCGRPETRKDEFFCCSICRQPCYCSRACQAMDWTSRHLQECCPIYHPEEGVEEENDEDNALDEIEEEEDANEEEGAHEGDANEEEDAHEGDLEN